MKRITLSLLLCSLIMTCHSQINAPVRGEFACQPNGLMYADTTMRKLAHMVDSLNLRFKSCDNNRRFLSCPQGRLYMIRLASSQDNMEALKKDMKANMDFTTFIHRYRNYIVEFDTTQTVIKITVKNGDNYYLAGKPSAGYDEDYELGDTFSERSGRWTWSYSAKDKYQKKNQIEARFLPAALTQQSIPALYGNYIQYVDCMIDTSARIFLEQTDSNRRGIREIEAVSRLNDYLNAKMNLKPKHSKDSAYLDEALYYISDEKCHYATEQLAGDAVFKSLLANAADSCIVYGAGSPNLQALVAAFISKEKSLEIMRHRRVMGRCSQDPSPRLHARDIALMAAETNSWDIFLRAHLDIMNDRFERRSDGSYAYGGRKTYLKELEILQLDIVDLMIGLSLRAGNTADNHYSGTIWRLGWALTETKDSSLFEQKAKQLIQDNSLDEFNRGLVFLLYRSYLYSLPDRLNANRKIAAIKNELGLYPVFIQSAIKELKPRSSKEARKEL